MNKQSSPAFTMGAKFHYNKKVDSPGPLAYQAKYKVTRKLSPRAIIGKQKRQAFKAGNVPGPGTYDVHSLSNTAGVIFSHSQQKLSKKNQLGPGQYNPSFNSVLAKYPTCKIGSQPRIKTTNKIKIQTPGPLQYNPNQHITHKKAPKAIFGTSQRLNRKILAKQTPGPGEYINNNINLMSRTEKTIKFGKQRRSITRTNTSPGPFDYKIQNQIEHNIKSKKGIIFGRKIKYLKTDADYNPAPNFYNSSKESVWKRSPAFSLTKQARQKQFYSTSKIPGPNNYNLESEFRKTGAIITTSQRKQYQNSQKAPGPGAYDIMKVTSKSGLKYSISKFIPHQKFQKTPGPGQYNPEKPYNSEYKTILIDKGGRAITQSSGVPGPGTYQIQSKNIMSKTMGVKIGSQKRQRIKTQMLPGPGSYTIPSYIGNVPYFSQTKK